MLGVQTVPFDSAAQQLIREMARHFGTEDGRSPARPAPCSSASRAARSPTLLRGRRPGAHRLHPLRACMVGCRVGAKNTLLKNYLWFAEKRGARILPEHQVIDVVPLGAADGSDGYRVTTERPAPGSPRAARPSRRVASCWRPAPWAPTACWPTASMAARCRASATGSVNSCAPTANRSAVRLPEDRETWNDVAISCSVHVDHDTHIEFVNYGRNADFMSLLYTVLVGKGGRVTRPLLWLGSIACHPLQWLKTLWPAGWSRRMVMLLVMQALDNAIALRARKHWSGSGYRLVTEQNRDKPNPTFIAAGNAAVAWLAGHTGGIAQSNVLEALGNIPDHGAPAGRRGDRRRRQPGCRRPAPARVRLPQPAGLRRRGHAWPTPASTLADHRGAGRARDGTDRPCRPRRGPAGAVDARPVGAPA